MFIMEPTFSFDSVDVLDYTARPYTNKKGEQVIYKSCLLRLESKLFRFKVDKEVDLSTLVGDTAKLTFTLRAWGDEMEPSISVSKVL